MCFRLQSCNILSKFSLHLHIFKEKFYNISRPHLLTLVMHQASWSTLRNTVDKVLSKRKVDFDPSAVLDFLVTCVYLQKQWQCRDKHVPKHDSGLQDVLALTDKQVNVMIEYCLEEISRCSTDRDSARNMIQQRIPLIVGCIPSRYVPNHYVLDRTFEDIINSCLLKKY